MSTLLTSIPTTTTLSKLDNFFRQMKQFFVFVVVLSGKTPTVVSPQLYRSRFLEAMDRYFLHVPDQWSGLGSGQFIF